MSRGPDQPAGSRPGQWPGSSVFASDLGGTKMAVAPADSIGRIVVSQVHRPSGGQPFPGVAAVTAPTLQEMP